MAEAMKTKRRRKRPVIGVTASRGRGRLMWWFNGAALRLAGARPVLIVPGETTPDIDGFDGFVLGGGDDLGADLYAGELRLGARIDPDRDALELGILDGAMARALPILGVCRGAQMINVYLGGSLHKDIYETFSAARRLRTALPRKTISLAPGSRIARIVRTERVRVNSLHNQSVDRLGEGLVVVGRDPAGIVQAVEHPELRFLIGVQWHPEFLFWMRRQRRLFRALVKAAAGGLDLSTSRRTGRHDG